MNSEDIEQLKNEYSMLVAEARETEDDLHWLNRRMEEIEKILDEYGEF